MGTPATTIYICSGVSLNHDYEHTIWFTDANSQRSYFEGKVVKTFPSYSYVRKSWSLKVEATMEQARVWSYLYFANPTPTGYSKTYYYFINNVEYVNDSTVELFLELDVMQTYLFDVEMLPCYVEREHVVDDTIGANLVDENLELGELAIINENTISFSDLCVLVQATYNPVNTMTAESMDKTLASRYDGIFGGLGLYAVNMADWDAWGVKLNLLDDEGISDGIITMWMYPKSLVTLADGESWESTNVTKKVKSVTKDTLFRIARNISLKGSYIPRNMKLYTYPYNFLYVTNNLGGSAVYRWEKFGDPIDCTFETVGALSPEGVVKTYPLNYNGAQHNFEEGLTMGGFPTCAWNQDTYKLWLAQNQHSQALSYASAGLTIAGGLGVALTTGGLGSAAGVGAMISGVSQIASQLAQTKDQSIQPPQAKGQHSSSVNVANGFQQFTFWRKSIDYEHAVIIDNYFSMYGYACKRVKVPNRNARKSWTYCKTIGCHVKGNICSDDLVKIQSIYNNGVTFWKNGDKICDYSQDNSIT